MQFGLTKLVLGFIEITEEEYKKFIKTRSNLLVMLDIEEKIDLLLETFAEFERELLDLGVRSSLFREQIGELGHAHRRLLNRRIANLLTTARLYVDQVKHDVGIIYGPETEAKQQVVGEFSKQYEARLGYRAMEALRNHMQHRGLPVHMVNYNYARDGEDADALLVSSVAPYADVARLVEDPKFKKATADELIAITNSKGSKKGYVNLTPLARDYVEGLCAVHESIRDLVKDDLAGWDSALTGMYDLARDQFGDELAGLNIVSRDPETKVVSESAAVFLELSERRRRLAEKNSSLAHLASRYVTGHPDAA